MPKAMLRLTGLWESSTRQGARMLSGRVNANCRLVILPNLYKAKDADPDYIAYLVPAPPPATAERGAASAEEDEVPF